MIKIEFSKLKQVNKTPQHFYVEVYWMLDGAIFMSVLWIRQEQIEEHMKYKHII